MLMVGYFPFDEPNHAALYKKIGRAQFTCPSWFSPEAKKLSKRILNPNSLTENLVTERKEKLVSMNAFELISRSQSFNHENFKGSIKRETYFTSKRHANEIMSKN
ncbi:CBL-interacting serine/threonine-protein kinase 9 [Glycine soja]